MEEERIAKKILNGKFHDTRSVGKQRRRWEDVAQRDTLQILGTGGLRRRVGDREELRCLLREARGQKGLYRHT
jgi:hypothetical protein